jgi:membrane protein
MKTVATVVRMLAATLRRWLLADSDQLAASIAFHGVLSLAPLLLLILSATSRLFGTPEAPRMLRTGFETLLGRHAVLQAGHLVQMILDSHPGGAATLTSLVMFVVFGSAVFRQIRHALSRIWGAPPRSFRRVLFERAVSYGVVPVVVVVALLVLVLSVAVSLAGIVIVMRLPRGAQVWGSVHAALSFVLLTLLLSVVFRFGPGVRVEWRDVWGGSALTALLILAGNVLIGVTIARSVLVPLYGAAGAVIVVLLWSYYTAHLLLFGGQFTRVYAERFGSRRELAHTDLAGPGLEQRASHVDTKTPLAS